MQADRVPGSSSSSEGVTCSHAAMASLQRSRKGQPVVVSRVEAGRSGTTCRRLTLRSRRGRGGSQGCRVRVGRGLEQLRRRLRCHGTTGVHHHDLVADHRGEREVIGDEQQRQTLVTNDARTSDDWSADSRPTGDTCDKRQVVGRQLRAPGLVPGARDGGFRSGCVSCSGLPSGSTCGRSPCTRAAHGGYRGGRGSRATRVG